MDCSQAGGAVSRMAQGAPSDTWLTGRRAPWLAITGAHGAVVFARYAAGSVNGPLSAAALAIVRLRGAGPSEIAIDDGAGQQAGPSELSERSGELFAESVQRHAETGRDDRHRDDGRVAPLAARHVAHARDQTPGQQPLLMGADARFAGAKSSARLRAPRYVVDAVDWNSLAQALGACSVPATE